MDVERDLNLALEMLSLPHRRAFKLVHHVVHPVVVISDANFEPTTGFGSMRLCSIVASTSSREGVVIDVPQSVLGRLQERLTKSH